MRLTPYFRFQDQVTPATYNPWPYEVCLYQVLRRVLLPNVLKSTIHPSYYPSTTSYYFMLWRFFPAEIKSRNLFICISNDFLWWLNTHPLSLPMGVKVHFLRWHEFSIQTHISLFPPTSLSRRIVRSTWCLIQHYVKISCTIILFAVVFWKKKPLQEFLPIFISASTAGGKIVRQFSPS